MRKKIIKAGVLILLSSALAAAQSLGNAGTIEGSVNDSTGAAIPGAAVSLSNRITGYQQKAETDAQGKFRFTNVPPNPYHMEASANGFSASHQDVNVRSSVPVSLNLTLQVAGGRTVVTVEGGGTDMLENVPYAHNDIDQRVYSKLPTGSPGSGLSDAITFASPGVVADSNGFFHPLGDHAQTSYSIDGQPISDQQSKAFSTQIPLNAVQSMELITGMPSAEYGDKTSLVVNAVTKSGLGQKLNGSFAVQAGSFGTYGEEATLAAGNAKIGDFLAVNTVRSGRFLDTPEFYPMHDVGSNGTIFNRFDFQPNGKDAFHLNLFGARNWFQTPTTYDQPAQDQRQQVVTFNVAPGYQHTFNAHALGTFDPFVRRDSVDYYPSRDPFNDAPATLAQSRTLTNYGFRADLSYVNGKNNVKIGTQIMQTRLQEQFRLGITDPTFNAVCVDGQGSPQTLPTITQPSQCAGAGFMANASLQPGLVPYDLTRGGSLFNFDGKAHVNEYAFYLQDTLTLGRLSLIGGLRFDQYNGLTSSNAVEPRVGLSYLFKRTNTVLRASYARTFETPYNENLIVSSATGAGGLAESVFGALNVQPLKPGQRSQYNAGMEQTFGKYLLLDVDYFWKRTVNAYDFDVLFNTPITFPISWRKSKLDGISARLSTPDIHGFQVFTTLGHNRARYFGPETGGVIFNSPLDTAVFRIDHDQVFQETTHLRYQRHKDGPWFAFTWRYDSGLVAGSVPDLAAALSLTAAQQAAIGFFCGGQQATLLSPITSCVGQAYGAQRIQIPKAGTENPDTNPSRIAPRHLFDLAAGTDNLFHAEHYKTTLRFTVLNLANTAALYNFLSTFSGTHFVTPRTYTAEIGFVF